MSLQVDALSQLNTVTYQLKLLEQELEKANTPEYIPALFDKLPVYDAQKTIQAVKTTLESFASHLPDIQPKSKIMAQKILRKASAKLKKIERYIEGNQSAKTQLHDSIVALKEGIKKEQNLLEKIPQDTAQEHLGIVAQIGALLGSATVDIIDLQTKLDETNKKIEPCKKELETRAKSQDPVNFAACISTFLTDYLDEQLVHIKERDVSLRPPFLESFFDDVYGNDPKPNSLCRLTLKLLTENKPLIKATIELNLLKAINQAYKTLQTEEGKPLLLNLLQASFHAAIMSVSADEKARKQQGINPLTIQERNLLLSNELKKNVTSFVLRLCFPKGAEDLELPEISVSIPGVKAGMSWVKSNLLWPLLENGLGDFFHETFRELSTDDALKTQILIEGYSQTNTFLKIQSTTKDKKLNTLSKISAFSFGIITAFFSFIFMALKNSPSKKATHPGLTQLNQDILQAMKWFAKGSKPAEFVCKHFGERLANSAGNILANALETYQITDFLNKTFQSIEKSLGTPEITTLFPRKIEQKTELKKQKFDQIKENRTTLTLLRNELTGSLGGFISLITDSMWPKIDETQANKATILFDHFLRDCLYYLVSFICFVVRAKSHATRVEKSFYDAALKIEQDEILMSATRTGIAVLKPLLKP